MTRADRSIADYDELFVPIRNARLVLGSDALRLIAAARSAVDDDIRTWEDLSRSTDFPDGAQLVSS
ncbi:Rossmann-fold NAD(P)-binding domain-containing protein [Mycolicibacterium monacense]|uniref:Uncharacterized protein n=1 Tax=Mycolicibacterium monacense TaxID=85693 RepID=A0AAD1MYB0_MYCMB|nr:hypothetical protein [Mycolicibacterium monacense]BBZ62393.1 hypothetical protein MMON_36940 [Mycolicibacterium monacense]